ncbi:MAG TPA: ATP-binding cassette domain-containing protein [Candidatus Saccharimonadales bacterium]|nr:ATP-binding cassette domain-containing protein [Candidatus Saccharimonadales bacterium]
MLLVREVSKTFDDRAVVDRVSFEVHPGEIFALLGPNGAGKTTLMRMITDILKPDSGEILLEGHPPGGAGRDRLAYLPEERGLYRKVKTLEALAYYGELKGMRGGAARRAAAQLLERVDLAEWARKPVQALSKGMQQKVQLCTALIGEPRLLVLDEPFTGLDPLNVQLFEELLAERRAAGAAVLLSTHQMNKVEELCDRALMINVGRVVLHGPVREIRRRYAGHAVLVRAAALPERIAGVSAAEPVNGEVKLTLEPGATSQSVLRELVDRGVEVESYALAALPLEEIFVKVVREGPAAELAAAGTAPEPASGPAGAARGVRP